MEISSALKGLWRLSLGYRRSILGSALCGSLRMTVTLVFVLACKHAVDIATATESGSIFLWIIVLVACVLLQLTLSAAANRIYASTGIAISNNLRNTLLTHILQSKWSEGKAFHSGDMMNRMQKDVDTVAGLLSASVPSIITTTIQLAGASLFMLYLDVRMATVIFCIMPFVLICSKLYIKRMRRLTSDMRKADSRIHSHIQESLQNRTLVAVMERAPMIEDTMNSLQSDLKSLFMRRNTLSIFSGLMVQLGFSAGYVTAFAWGVYGISAGTVTFGVLTAFLQLVTQVQRPIVELSRQIPAFINAMTSMDRLHELESIPLEERGDSIVLNGEVGVRISNVTFKYPDGARKIFDGFSYDFTPGSLTAVLGATGSGKSTLVRMLLALLTPDSGEITLYNNSTSTNATPPTRGNFIYVPQGNSLVSGTIRHNLQLGNPDATDEMMRNALNTAAADFVFSLPQGLDFKCGETGSGLSEGQAQRIAIARSLLRPGGILLLDEPTSSLDSETTKILLHRLSERLHHKTLILITHNEQTAGLCTSTLHLHRR